MRKALTNQRQPNKLKPNQRKHRQHHPQHGLHIQRHPKEALVRRILLPAFRVRGFKHPAPVARRAVDLVPPAQTDEPSACDVLEVVEVDGEEQDGYDEDEDEVGGEELEAEEVDEEGCCIDLLVDCSDTGDCAERYDAAWGRTYAEEEEGE